MSDFYGIEPGAIPGFADAGDGKFIGVQGLRGRSPYGTWSHSWASCAVCPEEDALAFEVCVRHVASVIEDQRRGEGNADPRGNPGQ